MYIFVSECMGVLMQHPTALRGYYLNPRCMYIYIYICAWMYECINSAMIMCWCVGVYSCVLVYGGIKSALIVYISMSKCIGVLTQLL